MAFYAGAFAQLKARISRTNAATAGTCGRPRTVTTWMVRVISGSVADSMTVEIVFAGQGTEKVDSSIEEELFEMLGDLYARMMR